MHETVASKVIIPTDIMKRIHFSSGFTLLELLVAMTLVALVTLIAATAFRLTIQAWERGA